MLLDERTELCDATALSTSGTGLALVGDVIDLSAARDIGNGNDLALVIQIDTAVTSGGAATLEFQLVSDAQAAIAADGSASVHGKTGAVAKASLVAGYEYRIQLPPASSVAYERYLGILQNVGTAALTAGKINAFIVPNPPVHKAYSDGIA